MDPRRAVARSGGNVVEVIPQRKESALSDHTIWAKEEDYNAWSVAASAGNPPSSNYEEMQSLPQSGSDPRNRKSRISQGGDSQLSESERDRDFVLCNNRSKEIGRIFFKTKLCGKFRNGVCPFITNCNFAHGLEELRHPPPNWQEIVASHDDDRRMSSEKREECQIPCVISSELGMENQRLHKARHCKKFYSDEGCPYGNNCAFIHDEQSKSRESVAINLGPSFGNETGNSGGGSIQKPSNWKTRICNKWERTGSCPFGGKCHFAHGLEELHQYSSRHVDKDPRYGASAPSNMKLAGVQKMATDTVVASAAPAPHSVTYGKEIFKPRPSGFNQRQEESSIDLQKCLHKINKIYGDWISEDERKTC